MGRERRHRTVAGGERGPVREPALGRERSRLGDRAAGEVDPGGMLRASGEASEREVARPAAHVEHRSRIEALTIQRFEHPAGDRCAHPRRRARDALCTAHSSKQHGSGRAGSSTIEVWLPVSAAGNRHPAGVVRSTNG